VIKKSTQDLLQKHGAKVKTWIEDIVSRDSTATLNQLITSIDKGQHELYFCYTEQERLIGVVTIVQIGDVMHLDGAAGDVLGEWDILDKSFVELCKQKNCTSYEFRGRKGFLKTFKKFGMKEKYTVMSRAV
jgi:hypothetical protein